MERLLSRIPSWVKTLIGWLLLFLLSLYTTSEVSKAKVKSLEDGQAEIKMTVSAMKSQRDADHAATVTVTRPEYEALMKRLDQMEANTNARIDKLGERVDRLADRRK